ncbi:hypothetical protein M8J76_016458 [Diaphorina citri]|nr:hypothetical protein M8J76_016458 [Diaphorina citri]
MDEIQAGMKPPDDPGAHGGGGGEGASGGDVTVRPPRPKILYEEDFDYEHYKVLVQPTYYTPVILVDDPSQDNSDVVHMICEDKTVRITSPSSHEPSDINSGTKPSLSSKRRSVPSLIDQGHLCDKRRSSRQRCLNKKEDPSLCIALRSVIPEELLPPREVDMFKDSPDPIRWNEDTMDLLAMFDDMEESNPHDAGELSKQFINQMSDGERNTLMSSYFGQSDREGADVLAFLSLHSSSNILNLCLSYLRQLAVKWATLWPSELKRLYCRIFSTVSKHFIGGRFNIYAERIEDSANAGAVGNARTNENDAGARDVVGIMRTNTLVLVLFGELILNDSIERAEFNAVEQDKVFPSLFFQDLLEAETSLGLSDSDIELYVRLKHFSYLWSLYISDTDITTDMEALDSLVVTLDEANFNDRLVLVNNAYYHVISKEVYGTLRTVLQVTRDLWDVVPVYNKHLHCDEACNKALFTQLVTNLEFSLNHFYSSGDEACNKALFTQLATHLEFSLNHFYSSGDEACNKALFTQLVTHLEYSLNHFYSSGDEACNKALFTQLVTNLEFSLNHFYSSGDEACNKALFTQLATHLEFSLNHFYSSGDEACNKALFTQLVTHLEYSLNHFYSSGDEACNKALVTHLEFSLNHFYSSGDEVCNKALFTQLVTHLEYSLNHEDTLSLVKLLKLNVLQDGSHAAPHPAPHEEEDGEDTRVEEEEEEDIYDVVTQYNYLLKLCYELKYNERCFKYSASYLNKLISRFKKINMSVNNSAQTSSDLWIKRRASCANRISDIISRLLYCIDKADHTLVSILAEDQYKQLILNLCQLICYQIEYMQDSANTVISPELNSVPFDTIQHWLVLYHIVKYEESRPDLNTSAAGTDLNISTESSPEKSSDDLYYRQSCYSTRLLFIAHEYLGKRSWCCHENGLLLFKMIEVVTEDYVKYNSRLNHDNTNFHQFLQHIDQVFYCLYGHPASKQCVRNYIKQKYYLQSHNALGVAFTYERAKQVAEFDTLSKNYSISLDVETMFRSIIREIPEAERPDKYIELVSSGIKRNASFSEIFSQVEPRLCEELRDIYYYIGDYHFKNKVFNKAINYYLLDICVNHNRVDAWAAMTLSQQKLIEMCLNSGDTIEEADTITSDCLWTCNSFKIILSLDSTLLPLYIEYGTFAYTIAAFSSRRIKCDSVVGVMSLEQFTALEKLKTELLATCSQNFLRATQVLHRHYKYNKIENDEKWLHLYMLGKYYEKTDPGDPKSCLNSYYESFEILRVQNGALYPARVNYSEPQTGAVEALELFYRIHATILKFIDRSGDQVLDRELRDFYLNMLRKLSVSSFVFGENDPMDKCTTNSNVTIVEDDAEDVEIICTVQEVMNKLLNMTQMIEEQEEDSQSEVSSSEDSESSSSDSESSESSDETSSSDSETDSKQTDNERNTKLNAKKRKPETDSSNEERNEKKIKVVDEMRGESRKRKSIDDSVEGNEQKRLKTRNDDKEPVIDVEEVEEEKNEPSVEMRENNECVSDNNEALDLKQKAEVLPRNETSVEKANEDKPNVQTMKEEPNEIHIGTAETSVKTGVEKEGDTATQKGERTENNKMTVDSERIVVQEETGNKLGDTVGKSSEPNVSAKPSESLIYINSIVNNSDVKPEPSSDANTVPVFNQNIRDSDSKQTFEVKANKYFPVPPKKAKLDSINLLNSINSSCDSIFDSLNKIASTCDSAIRSNETPVDNNVDNDSEVHAIETEVKHTQRVPSDSESCMAYVSVIAHTPSDVAKEKYVIENTMSESKPETSLNKSCESQGNSPTDHTKDTNLSEKTTGVPENTKSVGKSAEVRRISEDDIEIIEDKSPGNKNALETDVMVIDEDSNEEVQVLDPESGMFITVRQKKIKETHGDMENDKATVETANNEAANHDQGTTKDKTNDTRDGTKEVINNEVRTNDTKENTKEDEHKMEEDGISETIKGGTESLDDKETKDNAKNRKELNARSGKDKMDVEDSGSSSGDDSGSSDSETSGSSEEESEPEIAPKKKIPPKRKLATKSIKPKSKQTPRNDQSNKKKQERSNWKKDKKEIVSYCIQALEECHRRFPEHFKSLYRMAYHYFHSSTDRDVDKARAILLGDNGLFRARKQKDFFKQGNDMEAHCSVFIQGLWRTPIADLDRPGSFAYHMSRSIHLVVDLLSEIKDAKTLMDIAVALKDEPEAEKKYLRDNEREQICDDALNLVKKILHDNLTDVKRNTHLSKSDMKKIFLDARYIHQTYSKTWGTRDSVYSKIFVQMTKLLKSVLGGSETVEDSNTSGGGKKKQEERVKSGGDNGGDKTKPAADSVGDKAKPTGEHFGDRMKPVGDNVDRDGKEAGPRNPPLVGNVVPPPPSVSAAELMFGSHFLANTMRPQTLPRVNPTPLPRVLPNPPPLPRVIPSPQPLARVPSPQTLGKVTPSPQTLARVHPTPQPLPRMNLTPPVEMSLQQKLAAKQNQTGSAKTIKPLNTAQTHGVVLTNRPGLSVSTEPHGAGPGKLTEPGKILAKPSGTGSAPKTINVTINPTKYMKQKKDALKSASNAKTKETNAPPHLNIKPLQRPPPPSDTQDHTAFKLPKAVSLTKVQPRPESPKPRPLDSTPKVIDLTAPVLPKAISVTKVHVEDRAASPQGQKSEASKQVKIKKLQRDGEKNLMSQSGKSKKQLGPKSKTKEAGSFSSSQSKVSANISSKTKNLANTSDSSKMKDAASSTSVLKNFRKAKESKDLSKDKEIIMIELD